MVEANLYMGIESYSMDSLFPEQNKITPSKFLYIWVLLEIGKQ